MDGYYTWIIVAFLTDILVQAPERCTCWIGFGKGVVIIIDLYKHDFIR